MAPLGQSIRENRFLAGGKVVFGGGWKFGNQEVVHWLYFVHWLLFDQGFFRRNFSRCKSFADLTYNDTKNLPLAKRGTQVGPQKLSTG
ncbi:MAG: hypothetical protein COA78_34530 [Blastopirellula sp.]|nr:MAG: hypothetical protein COA78_34530 [Blastopirellula sp.]